MASLNKVFLLGNLVRDPDLRGLPNGQSVCELRMAVSRRYTNGSGQEVEDTCFVDVDEVHRPESAFEWIRRWSLAVLVFAAVTALFALGAHRAVLKDPTAAFALYPSAVIVGIVRSEERRVGKEC